MADWPESATPTTPASINAFHPLCGIAGGVMAAAVATSSQAYPSANLAMYIPWVNTQVGQKAYQIGVYNGATLSGNVDVGIYDQMGARLISSGTTAQAGISTIQAFNITDTVLPLGLLYMALSCDNVTATFQRLTNIPAIGLGGMGVYMQATAFVLPSTATFALPTQAYLPYMSVMTRSVL